MSKPFVLSEALNGRTGVHFSFDDSDGFFNPASRAFTALRFSAYSLPSIGAT
jgi:hypothetical protein